MAAILYLEDELWQVEGTVVTFLEKELAHTVKVVQSTAETREELSTTRYDVVFLDIMLDSKRGIVEFENSGLQVAQLILRGEFAPAGNPTTLPIIIASGVWDATAEDKTGKRLTIGDWAKSLGIPDNHFLYKPFLADELRHVLEVALGKE